MENETLKQLIKIINHERKLNKNKWSYYCGVTASGKPFKIKFYNTWIQVLEIENVKYSSGIDITVKEFNNFLEKNLA